MLGFAFGDCIKYALKYWLVMLAGHTVCERLFSLCFQPLRSYRFSVKSVAGIVTDVSHSNFVTCLLEVGSALFLLPGVVKHVFMSHKDILLHSYNTCKSVSANSSKGIIPS